MCLKNIGKCPKCGNQEVVWQVSKIFYYRIKYTHRHLLDLDKIKKQINRQLKDQTHACDSCGAEIAGFNKFTEILNSFKQTFKIK